MEFIIEKCVMLTKLQITNSRKNQNARRKEKLQVLEDIGIGHH